MIAVSPNPSATAPLTIWPEQLNMAVTSKHVVIIMATYNGARYVEEQINSIQKQTFQDWMLLVRDDGSRDNTCQRVACMAQQDRRIRLLADDLGNRGTIGNFAVLMEAALQADADYLFFADQDDIWQPEKLSVMLAAMGELESKLPDMPLLVHCDLEVVDEKLHSIAESFTRYSGLSPNDADLGVLLCQNQVTGCACMINRDLLELAHPVPPEVLMHDWWLALLAAASGRVGYIPMPLVKYRQHGGNVLGAAPFRKRVWRLMFSVSQWKGLLSTFSAGIWQSRLLVERLRARGATRNQNAIDQTEIYAQILNVHPFARGRVLKQHGIGRYGLRTGWVFGLLTTLIKNHPWNKPVV